MNGGASLMGQKIVSFSVKNDGLGEVENSILAIFSPPKDAEVTPVVLKSILKKKLQSHGFMYQPYVNNESIDQVEGSVRRVKCKEKLEIDGFKASKIDGPAAADDRKITFESDTTGVKDKYMGNKTSIMREDKRKTEKVKTNVEIEKAASKGKTINPKNWDEDSKRIKLAKANGGDNRTSMKAGLISAPRRSVKNHAVGDEVRGRNCVEWNDNMTYGYLDAIACSSNGYDGNQLWS